MSTRTVIDELRSQLDLKAGTPSLVLGVVGSDAVVDEARTLMHGILRATPLRLEDLGRCTSTMGPGRWAEATRRVTETEGFLLSFAPATQLEARAFAILLNAERQLLQGLTGPVLLVVSRQTEAAIRSYAHDFFTWVARSYELPEPRELHEAAGTTDAADGLPKAPPEPPIRFLHLSDLHLRPARVQRYDQDRVLAGLVEFLERDRSRAPLDLVFVTGDLAFSGKPEEYALVVELLRAIIDVTGVPAERVFPVPGNHDVDRAVGKWLLRTLQGDQDSIAFFEDPVARNFHRRKLDAYEASLRPLLGEGRPLGLCVGGDAVELVEVRGTRLAVASFNSSWFSQGDSDKGLLWLGDPNVSRAVDRIADEHAAFAIALLHHPFEFFHELERDLVESWFERGFDLMLRGHLHTDKTRSIVSQRGGYVEVAAPAAYHGSQWPNGCFLGEVRAQRRTVRLRPLAFVGGPDPWVLDTTVFPDDADDGYCHSFVIAPKRRRKSALAAAAKLAVKQAFEESSPYERQNVMRRVKPGSASAHERAEEIVAEVATQSPELRTALFAKDSGVALVSAIEGMSEPEASMPRIDVSEPEGFERALAGTGRLFLRHTAELGLQRARMSERGAIPGVVAALGLVVEGPIATEIELVGGLRPDIMLGRPPGVVDIIEVGRAPLVLDKLGQLEHTVLRCPHARHGAVVLLGSLPEGATEPAVERRRTASGRELFVLHV